MTNQEKLNCLEELFDIPENTLQEETALEEMSEWDSMARIALVAMLDDTFDKLISYDKVKGFQYIRDIMTEMD